MKPPVGDLQLTVRVKSSNDHDRPVTRKARQQSGSFLKKLSVPTPAIAANKISSVEASDSLETTLERLGPRSILSQLERVTR